MHHRNVFRQIRQRSGSRARVLAVAALLLAGLFATPAPAIAGPSIIKRPFGGARPYQLDVHAGFAWIGKGLAAGARFGIPIIHNGFIKKINNSIHINFGADLYFIDAVGKKNSAYSMGLGIPVTLHWEFYFTPRWSAFGEVGPNIFIHSETLKGHGWDWSPGHWFIASAGGRYFLSQTLALTLRLGSPYSSFGLSFLF